MSSFTLKCIAMVTMIIDHVGAVFFPEVDILRIIGRVSFPIFCFLLVEGFFHTRNVYKYLLRLIAMGIISEPAFDRLFHGSFFYTKSSNIFFTLSIGLILMIICSKMPYMLERSAAFAAILLSCQFIHVDYGMYGVAMIGGFYFLKKTKAANVVYQGMINIILMGGLQAYGIIGTIATLFYNQKEGCKKFKYAFYILYPLHLYLFLLIANLH